MGLRSVRVAALLLMALALSRPTPLFGQELGGAGTVQGTVKDPTGGVMQSVTVRIANLVTGFSRSTSTDATGRFVFRNLPPNGYHITVEAQGFNPLEQDVDVRSSVPIELALSLKTCRNRRIRPGGRPSGGVS